jgi:SsrA-binding protein
MRIVNKKAYRNYNVEETFEAGIVLTGAEVKSVRSRRCNLSNAYVKFMGDELWLINVDLAKYKYDGSEQYDSKRRRKLLLSRKEIEYLKGKIKQSRLTLVPLSIYTTRGLIKVEVGLGKGKKKYQKKEIEKERDVKRQMARIKREHMI